MSSYARLAAEMAARGTRSVFGITGSGATLTLLDELEKVGIEAVRTHFEGSAALMAGTVGRLSGQAGVAFGIKGPGLANMVPGLAASWLEAFPMVAVVEAYPPGSGPAKAHKRLDQEELTRAVVKGRRYLSEEGPGFGALAGWAESEVPGPVLLELGGPVPNAPPVPVPQGGSSRREELLARVKGARRPVVVAGTLALRMGWWNELSRLPVPVFSTAAAKGVVDEAALPAAGVYTGVGLALTPESRLLPQADLVIGLGLRPNEVLATKPFGCASVNVDPVDVPGADSFGFDIVSAELPSPLWEILAEKGWGLDQLRETLEGLDRAMGEGFLPGKAFGVIARCLGRSVRMVLDTGYFCTIGEHAWKAPSADLCLFSGQGRYMGTVIPMALGAAVHDPATPVVAVAGDGGIGMYAGEIRLAVERRLPILFVLMTDGRFGSIATRALQDGLTRVPLEMANPSWLKVMEGFGLPCRRAVNAQELHEALSGWNPAQGPAYLEIQFDAERYERMCENIR